MSAIQSTSGAQKRRCKSPRLAQVHCLKHLRHQSPQRRAREVQGTQLAGGRRPRRAAADEEDDESTSTTSFSSSGSSSSNSSGSTSTSSSTSSHGSHRLQPSRRGLRSRSPTRRQLSPGRSHASAVLSRVEWRPSFVRALIERVSMGTWPEGPTAVQRYRRERLVAQFEWRVRNLRRDRFSHRLLGEEAIQAAVDADDAAASEGESGAGASSGSAEDDDDDNQDTEVQLELLGDAADDQPSTRERVLFVQALSRDPADVDSNGVRLRTASQWYEVVATNRVMDALRMLWQPAGNMSLSATKLHQIACRDYVGISLRQCADFFSQQESAQLSKSNAVEAQMVAPSLPQAVMERWCYDVTFFDSTLPSGKYVGFVCVIDALSRFAFTKCLADKSAAGLASFLEETMFAYGSPRMLQADSAAENKSASVRLVAERFGVQTLRFTKPHASQENGMVERSFRTLKDSLRRAVLETQSAQQPIDIVDLLRNVTKSYNITPHASLGNLSPWDVFFGRKPSRITGAVLLSPAEGSSPGKQQGGGAGAGSAKLQRDGTSVSRSSIGRRTAAEIRNLASQAGSASGPRQRRTSALLSEDDYALPSQQKGKSRQPLTVTMSALSAARVRLGIPAASPFAAGSHGLLRAVTGRGPAASSAGASSSAASGSAGGLQAERALAIAFDQSAGKLLYLMQWGPPFRHQPSWVYASTMDDSDAALQAWIKKDTGHKPVVFETPFVGIDASLDRGRPIPMQVVLQEVEDAADHQSEAAGLQDEDGEEEDGVLVSSAGGAARQAAAAAPNLRVDGSGPLDALRKAQQAAEAAAAAAQAVVTAARQERVASAMRSLRQELQSDDEGEGGSNYRGSGRAGSSRGGKSGRGRR